MKRGVALSILFLMLTLPLISAGFVEKWLTGNVVEDPAGSSCIQDDVLFLRYNDPQVFDGKMIALVGASEEMVTIEVEGSIKSILGYGQESINGIMMILGEVFGEDDPEKTLVLVKVRSESNACPSSQLPSVQRARQCTAQFSGTRGESALVGGKKVRIIDLYGTGALLDVDGIPAKVYNNQYYQVNDVSIVVYKNNIETAEMFMVNENCCSIGMGQAISSTARINTLLQPSLPAPVEPTIKANFLNSFRNIFS